MMGVFDLNSGAGPLIVSIPHDGRLIPDDIAVRMTDDAHAMPDTDWHVRKLYDFLGEFDATVIAANYSRYVVDLNRPPDGAPLYPGKTETSLCPVATFDGAPIYSDGETPSAEEIGSRVETWWRPYHDELAAQIARVRGAHGYALLWDAHSIRSHVETLFEGRLPDLNIGTAGGASCPAVLGHAVAAAAEQSFYSSIVNGRFKGGFITRRYGAPSDKVYAIQLELSQATYMNEAPPYAFDDGLAAGVRPILRSMIAAFMSAAARLA